MSCTKNIQKFLGIIPYQAEHKFATTSIGVFMIGVSETFIVREKCLLCGCENKRSFVTYEELIKMGHTEAQIQSYKLNEVC